MNEAAPITWLIQEIHNALAAAVTGAAQGISAAVTPLLAVCFGIYIILITLNYLRGAESEPVLDFGLRIAGFAVILGLGLNAANYSAIVIPIVTGLGGDLASAVSGGTATANSLDTLALGYLDIMANGFDRADGISETLVVVLKSAVILLGLVPFLVGATFALVVADVGSLMIAIVGPFFFGCLLFPATRQYFSAWVNSALSYAFVPLFVAVIAVLSVSLSQKMLGTNIGEASFKSVVLAAIGNILLLFLVKQVGALASSLSAGGINVAVPGGLGSAAKGISNSVKGSAREVAGAAKGYSAAKQFLKDRANKGNEIKKAG